MDVTDITVTTIIIKTITVKATVTIREITDRATAIIRVITDRVMVIIRVQADLTAGTAPEIHLITMDTARMFSTEAEQITDLQIRVIITRMSSMAATRITGPRIHPIRAVLKKVQNQIILKMNPAVRPIAADH